MTISKEDFDWCLSQDPRIERSIKRVKNFISAYIRGIISEEDYANGVLEEGEYCNRLIDELGKRPEVRQRLGTDD